MVALLVAACGGKKQETPAPPAEVRVLEPSIVVKKGTIGQRGEVQYDASYVLVDIVNGTAQDRVVDVDGVLLDAAGAELGPLAVDSLFVPAGARRTFAPIADKVHAEATSARVRVLTAPTAPADQTIEIAQEKESREPDGSLAVDMRLTNVQDRPCQAIVIASFHDAAGAIVAREFRKLNFKPKGSVPFRFVGPKTATETDVYLGEVVY
jgi:hypothetical protein